MNLSDWITQTSGNGTVKASPDWIAALNCESEFREGSPFAIDRENSILPNVELPVALSPETPSPSEYDRGFAAGEVAGRAAAEAEMASEKHQRAALRLAFRELDQAAMDALAQDLTDTVMALCDSVLAEHSADPESLKKRAMNAARRLGSASGDVTLHLNPEDIADLEEGSLSGWQIEADPKLERGSIVLAGEDGGVRDGPADWRRAIAAALRG